MSERLQEHGRLRRQQRAWREVLEILAERPDLRLAGAGVVGPDGFREELRKLLGPDHPAVRLAEVRP